MPGRAQWLKFKAFQFRHGKIGMEQGRIPGIGPQQQAQAQGDHQAGHPGRGRGDDAFVAGTARFLAGQPGSVEFPQMQAPRTGRACEALGPQHGAVHERHPRRGGTFFQ